MKKLLALISLVMLVVAFGCQQQPADTTPAAPVMPTQAELDSIKAVLEKAQMDYAQAWCNKDIEFIRTCWSHDPDVMLIPPATRERLVGFDAVEKWYMGNFDAIDKVDFKIHELMIKVTPDGKSAVITYYVENDYIDKATGKPQKLTPRVCVVKTVENGEWKQIYGDASFSVEELTKK
jgi:hypothetical protein